MIISTEQLLEEEEKPISNLFPYVCPSCGGHLETDDKRKLMICRSCGNTYDYDYFGEEHLLEAADKALADSNFSAAKDMYSFMLDKEPSNARALRGLILAANKVARLYDITQKIKDGSFVQGTFNLEKYRAKSDSEFFEKTDKILSLYKEYNELNKTMKQLESEEDEAEKKLRDDNDLSTYNYEDNDHLIKKLILASVILAILIISDFIFGTDYATPAWVIVALICMTCVFVFYIIGLLVRMRLNKREPKNPVLVDLDEIDKRIDENKGEMNRVIREINAVFKEMNSL